jgi:hypothetical protein
MVERIWDVAAGVYLTEITEWHRDRDGMFGPGWDDGDARWKSWGGLLEIGPVYDEEVTMSYEPAKTRPPGNPPKPPQ